jgi:DNA-binding LytR/AlgR family response regulator
MEVKALVVEDEVAAARRLVKMLSTIDPGIRVVKVSDSIWSTVEWLGKNPDPDLIFLDIHLADGSGFKIFERIEIRSPVIFITAFDQYAVQAFKVNSVDYLLKPVKHEELVFSINKYKRSRLHLPDVSLLISEIGRQQDSRWQKRFIVQFADKLKSIDVNDIAYFIAQEKSVFLISDAGPGYAIDYTLEKLEPILDPDKFYRINRKFIISFHCIKTMYSWSRSRIKLVLDPPAGQEVIVSSERSAGFRRWLNR